MNQEQIKKTSTFMLQMDVNRLTKSIKQLEGNDDDHSFVARQEAIEEKEFIEAELEERKERVTKHHKDRATEAHSSDQYDYMKILPNANGSFTVKGYGRWTSGCLCGQVKISFIDSFNNDEYDLMKELYPNVDYTHKLLEPENSFNHLEGEDL